LKPDLEFIDNKNQYYLKKGRHKTKILTSLKDLNNSKIDEYVRIKN
jgi:hypothetical protein